MYYIPLSQIDPNPWQPRQALDPAKIQELADSIRSYAETRRSTRGLLQLPAGRIVYPPTLDEHAAFELHAQDTTYQLAHGCRVQLAFGHRRKAAFALLSLPELPVELGEYSDEEMATMAITENDERDDLTPIERARSVRRLMADFKLTQAQVAQKLDKSRPAVANLLRLLDLPEELQASLASGQISMRQADALLALFAVPDEIRQKGEAQWEGSTKPSRIVQDALDGESSDSTRARTKSLIECFSEKLNTAPWPLDQVFAYPERQAAACQDCQARLDAGNWKYCLNIGCYRARTRAYQALTLEKASQAAGIPVLEAGINLYNVHDFRGYRGEEEDLKKILEIKPLCPNLRLAWADRDNKPHVEGNPHAGVVCAKRKQFCTCQNGLNAARELARRAQSAPAAPSGNGDRPEGEAPAGKPLSQVFEEQDLAALARQAHAEKRALQQQVKALRASAEGLIAQSIGDGHPGAWTMILRRVSWNQASGSENASVGEIRGLIAEKIVEHDILGYGGDDDPEIALSRINQEFKKAGLPLLAPDGSLSTSPAMDDPLARLAHRWERVKGWIDSLANAAPTSEAVRGNIDNLEAIDKELAGMLEENPALAGDPFVAPILADEENGVTAHLERLVAVQEVLERPDWNSVGPDEFRRVSWLCHTPAGDVNFKSKLESATAPVLAYALALTSGVPNHGARAAALRSRLNALRRAA